MQRGHGYKRIVTENKDAGFTLEGVRRACKRLKTNGMDSARKPGTAGVPTVRTAKVVDKVRALYEDSHDVSISDVMAVTGLRRSSAQRVLKTNLGFESSQKMTMQRLQGPKSS